MTRPALTILAAAVTGLCLAARGGAIAQAPYAPQFSDPKPFAEAIAAEKPANAPAPGLTGISVPHHMPAADLIARGFWLASAGRYDRIVVLLPDHFTKSPRPFATTAKSFDTAFGPVRTEAQAAQRLVRRHGFASSDLFANDHAIGALLPFVAKFFPNARIVPVAVSANSVRADWDAAVRALAPLLGPRTLIVQSTDYSHFLPKDVARQRDQETLSVLASADLDAIAKLRQPQHMDCIGCQYVHSKLQAQIYRAQAVVAGNRNSAQDAEGVASTTSYIVLAYSPSPPPAAALKFKDHAVWYFGGDVMFGRYLTQALADPQVAARLYGEIVSRTGGGPLILNLEGVLLDEPPPAVPGDVHIMHASLAKMGFAAMNVKGASLANNHSFDAGAEGFAETKAILARSSVKPILHGAVADFGPFRVLGLNFVRKWRRPDFPIATPRDIDDLCQSPAAPPVVAFVHWGPEYKTDMAPDERAAADRLFDCGASLVVGAHPHRRSAGVLAPRGGEQQIVYSLGNMLYDQNGKVGSGALLEVRVFRQGTVWTRLLPLPNLYDLGTKLLQDRVTNRSVPGSERRRARSPAGSKSRARRIIGRRI